MKGAALFLDGIWEVCLLPSKQQKVYQGASVLTSCGSLPLWNYPGIAPDLSWAGEEWLVGREKRPKGQYGSVKLEISNWRKISAVKANKPFERQEREGGGGRWGRSSIAPTIESNQGSENLCHERSNLSRRNHLCNAAPTKLD